MQALIGREPLASSGQNPGRGPSSVLSTDDVKQSAIGRSATHAPLNRFVRERILQVGHMLQVRANAANMSLMDYVMTQIHGEPHSIGLASLQSPNYDQEIQDATRSFTRLFNHGVSFTQLVESSVVRLDPNQATHVFTLASSADLLRGNLAISIMLEDIIFNAISSNPNYAAYCYKIQSSDFREIKEIPNHKIQAILKQCGITDDQGKVLARGSLTQQMTTALTAAVENAEIRKRIIDILYCIVFRSEREMIRLRLTGSKFLDPRLLSQMSQGQITIEEANLILSCVGIKVKNIGSLVCDSRTGEYDLDLLAKLRKENNPPSLCFIDPSSIKLQTPSKINLEEILHQTNTLAEATEALAGLTYQKLTPILGLIKVQCHEYVRQQIVEGGTDHTYLRKLIFEPRYFEKFFKENSSPENGEAITICFAEIRQFLASRLETLDQFIDQLPNQKSNLEDCLTFELEKRLQDAFSAKDRLSRKFEEYKHIIKQFLIFSQQTFELNQFYPYQIRWKMDGIEVKETITLEKSCSIFRRLDFPVSKKDERPDLPYFDKEGDSVEKRWRSICQECKLSDAQLANRFFSLYINGTLDKNENPKIKEFLVPLIILLMGKEPAMDRSSLAANFILLLAVRFGIISFSQALKDMPMIPQGAISAKQFLLYMSGHPLDTISGVQFKKDPRRVLPSYFLPTVATFVGTANDWAEKYDGVATFAVKCCQRLFILPTKNQSRSLNILKMNLGMLLGQELQVWEIPHALDPQRIKLLKAEIEQACLKSIESMDKTLLPKDETSTAVAIKICQEKLASRGEESITLLAQLNQHLGEQYPRLELCAMLEPNWSEEIIEGLKESANLYLIANGETDNLETAIERCQRLLTPGIDPHHPKIQELKMLLDKIHRRSVPYCELGEAIEYDMMNDDDDEIGKWAIEYILNLHPLKQVKAQT